MFYSVGIEDFPEAFECVDLNKSYGTFYHNKPHYIMYLPVCLFLSQCECKIDGVVLKLEICYIFVLR